ncbi:MAG: peptidoglycan binding protein CsiV [gamma proteobacterium symbiont of Bathyaustriella thionipta]|nr:peptidoglycan binding protein CsiV [gamma proteobacterium symbiont of Bathyaustriella thionipta]MCU7949846.1 peptidoglycan binding protein CsiV [gamma proteobacterium symbiont of Bathyaustriella thionipta]MCU7954604.1 peptidoglycan binding protein CsiV [gamma proteobacterium symbiont of Bathyaustriella thionipta]MCU7956537.1 peptidoglycan binding protein CsiV [gamma proteobacterium symbiont of Bathyaustriella thionipta]MCU7966943.1 peptidoglycan binding protein CsiV [gamma proteobacterium sy
MPNILKTIFCFFLFISISLPLFAQTEKEVDAQQSNTEQSTPEEKDEQQYYIIEVILFRHINEQGKQDEFWSRPNLINDNSISDLVSNTTDNNPVTNDIPALAEYNMQNQNFFPLRNGIAALTSENYKLSESAAHLRYSPNYKLLAHFGWTQRSLSKQQALPVRIISNQFSDDLIPAGDLNLYVSRYLHIEVDLSASQCVYIQPVAPTETNDNKDMDKALDEQLENGTAKPEEEKVQALTIDNTPLDEGLDVKQCVNQVYQFKQNRKMRSRELHYLDNPVFGMLIYVTPFTTSPDESE